MRVGDSGPAAPRATLRPFWLIGARLVAIYRPFAGAGWSVDLNHFRGFLFQHLITCLLRGAKKHTKVTTPIKKNKRLHEPSTLRPPPPARPPLASDRPRFPLTLPPVFVLSPPTSPPREHKARGDISPPSPPRQLNVRGNSSLPPPLAGGLFVISALGRLRSPREPSFFSFPPSSPSSSPPPSSPLHSPSFVS
jgi:hypothetical protein